MLSQLDCRIFGLEPIKEQYAHDVEFKDVMEHCKEGHTWEVKQWYTHVIGSTKGHWEELKDKFYLAFFPMSSIVSLPMAILDSEQCEKQPIGAT